ncbi:hypothetical protein VA7868_00561 [Vibrio aerogenes CECT 7868]|uniref:Flagellar Assembly Protein A N-terminal region domain-containing protein n=1 Tax=Vibrio aerogenes CECT 7868 TaxID=1216006 RepID=A0A1M5VZ10_9VIBR|nr:FapA family protein [Vibrio aerogenes]SHH80418.1 hypothetical protein VA7868_00561 [Vibrio aerogenes CECT 7868]
MWSQILSMAHDGNSVIARLEDSDSLDRKLSKTGISETLEALNASSFYLDSEALESFINFANEGKGEAFQGLCIAEKRNASVTVDVEDDGMIANMVVIGAYCGRGLRGSEIVQALAEAHVTKGINKIALKKVLVMSRNLAAGEEFVQPVAQGKPPVHGADEKFMPLVEDVTKRVLAPQRKSNSSKLDMRNLGETITVGEGDEVMRRVPATKGIPGYTVLGKEIESKPGNNTVLKPGKGTEISRKDPNLLLASTSGLPIIKDKTVDIDNALCMQSVSVGTGHVKFKGSLVVTGNIDPGMIVRATGSITVAGFIESADVQAQGDILVGKGIIGHTTSDEENKTCVVKSGSSIKANYAQNAELQAQADIHLALYGIGNNIRCGRDLVVLDSKESQGTLSGGVAKVGNSVVCYNLGVEGDTPTHVEAFASYTSYREKLNHKKNAYSKAQEETMNIVRRELDFNKKPKHERNEKEAAEIADLKQKAEDNMKKAKEAVERFTEEFDALLEVNTVTAKSKVYGHVTVCFGDEKTMTKRAHGASVFSFNKYNIKCTSLFNEDDLAPQVVSESG